MITKFRLNILQILFLFCIVISAQVINEEHEVYPGIKYIHISNDTIPLSTHILEIELTKEAVKIEVGIANDAIGHGGETVSSFAKRHQNETTKIAGAVNGDFFGGNPHSAENNIIVKGDFAKGVSLNRSQFGILNRNDPFIDKINLNGLLITENDTLIINELNHTDKGNKISIFNKFYGDEVIIRKNYFCILLVNTFKFPPNKLLTFAIDNIYYNRDYISFEESETAVLIDQELFNMYPQLDDADSIKVFLGTTPQYDNVYSLIGRLPRLITNGEIPETYIGFEGLSNEGFMMRHPRTAVGFSKDKTKLFIVLVDGRQENLSIGIGLKQLAEFMLSIGCYEALNLDGGGSSAMFVKDKIVNSPSDQTGERSVHNFLYVTYSLN